MHFHWLLHRGEMPRRLGPTTLLRSEVEVPVIGWSAYWVIGGEHAGHRAQTVGNTAQSGDVFGAEDYAVLTGVVVFEDAVNLAGDVSELLSGGAVIKSRLLSTGIKSGQFRVVASREDFDDVSVAEPITLPPLNHVAIHIVEEDLFGSRSSRIDRAISPVVGPRSTSVSNASTKSAHHRGISWTSPLGSSGSARTISRPAKQTCNRRFLLTWRSQVASGHDAVRPGRPTFRSSLWANQL